MGGSDLRLGLEGEVALVFLVLDGPVVEFRAKRGDLLLELLRVEARVGLRVLEHFR